MELAEAMQQMKHEVDSALKEFFVGKRKEAERIHPSVVELVDQITDVTLRGGKRIRPFLCFIGYSAVIPALCHSRTPLSRSTGCSGNPDPGFRRDDCTRSPFSRG